jgi:hypothetical protein
MIDGGTEGFKGTIFSYNYAIREKGRSPLIMKNFPTAHYQHLSKMYTNPILDQTYRKRSNNLSGPDCMHRLHLRPVSATNQFSSVYYCAYPKTSRTLY